jgi:hypothetical protein
MRRERIQAPDPAAFVEAIEAARYVGSPEHKTFPSFAGPPVPRADASKCDPDLADPQELSDWLRAAMRAGNIGGPWEQNYPRYVWHSQGGDFFEGRLTNATQGEYKGYPLSEAEFRSIS